MYIMLLSKKELEIILDYVNEMIVLFEEDKSIYNRDMNIRFEEYEFIGLRNKLYKILKNEL